MSVNDSTVKGKFDELAGKTKQAFGDMTGDQSAANSGATQEIKGHGEQAWGSVKEAAHDSAASRSDTHRSTEMRTDADNAAHDTRNSVTSAADGFKDRVKNAVDDFKK